MGFHPDFDCGSPWNASVTATGPGGDDSVTTAVDATSLSSERTSSPSASHVPSLSCWRSSRRSFLFFFSFFRRLSDASCRFFRRSRFFRSSLATTLASLLAFGSYLLSNASMVTARNRVRNVYLPTMTHMTKYTDAPHPAYSMDLNMMNSQSSNVSTWNVSSKLW